LVQVIHGISNGRRGAALFWSFDRAAYQFKW
jgi:hypothetical protein